MVLRIVGQTCGEIDRKRIEEGLLGFGQTNDETAGPPWNQQLDWLLNAETEHGQRPFRAIVAVTNSRNRDFVLEGDGLSEATSLWSLPQSCSPSLEVQRIWRNELRLCSGFPRKILFVDPHFRPNEIRWRRPLQAFLAVTVGKDSQPSEMPKFEIHVNDELETTFLTTQCQRSLPDVIPAGGFGFAFSNGVKRARRETPQQVYSNGSRWSILWHRLG